MDQLYFVHYGQKQGSMVDTSIAVHHAMLTGLTGVISDCTFSETSE